MRSSQLTTPRHPLVEQRRARRRHISGHRKTQFLPSPRYMDITCMQSPPDPLSTSSTTPSPFPPSRLPAPVSRPARPINPNHHQQQQQQPCGTSTGTSSSSPTAPKSPCRNSKPAATWCRTRSNCLRIPTPVSQHHTYISIPFPPTYLLSPASSQSPSTKHFPGASFAFEHLSTPQIPVVACFLANQLDGSPFRVSVHSWERPGAGHGLQGVLLQQGKTLCFEARVFVDGLCNG